MMSPLGMTVLAVSIDDDDITMQKKGSESRRRREKERQLPGGKRRCSGGWRTSHNTDRGLFIMKYDISQL